MKKLAAIFLVLSVLFSGCQMQSGKKQYSKTFLDLFDTVTTVVGQADSAEAFQAQAQAIHDELLYYHKLFDIYQDYEGVNNAKTINDQAGIAPVQVDEAMIRLLQDCREYYRLTEGCVNVAMGSVLKLWHDARAAGLDDPENAKLPDAAALQAAAEHSDMEQILIDEAAGTVFLTDQAMRLDLGAVAKGWATQRVAESAPEGLLLSVGGNVCATGAKKADGTPWIIGVQSPEDASSNLHTLKLTRGSVVTSGDYQRSYTVEGKAYHHIIDPQTQMPGEKWRAVSVLCADSGLADALSTGLFLLDLETGKALAAQCGAEALWIDGSGAEYMTEGFRAALQTQ